jgi:hypothetical protein
MPAGIRTNELRKVYNTAPPLAAGGGGFAFAEKRSKGKQPKPEVVALNGISLDIPSGEIFCLLGPNGAGKLVSTTFGKNSPPLNAWWDCGNFTRRLLASGSFLGNCGGNEVFFI